MIVQSTYKAPFLLSGGHLQTIFAAFFRTVSFDYDRKKRIETPDRDFLDLHLANSGPKRSGTGTTEQAIILTHGFEGNAGRNYMRGMAKAFVEHGWDVCAWDLRGCGEELNRRPEAYHSGKTKDLHCVIQTVLEMGYDHISLVGFSLGGNMTLKYLGERGASVNSAIRGAAVFSVPVDLQSGSRKISRFPNWPYSAFFLRSVRQTIRRKAKRHEEINTEELNRIRTLEQFDDAYTAPLHGFENARDYYEQASSKPFIPDIERPTLIVNAKDDPFLPEKCYPVNEAQNHEFVTLEMPDHGGHVGFVSFRPDGMYWSERRTVSFLGSE